VPATEQPLARDQAAAQWLVPCLLLTPSRNPRLEPHDQCCEMCPEVTCLSGKNNAEIAPKRVLLHSKTRMCTVQRNLGFCKIFQGCEWAKKPSNPGPPAGLCWPNGDLILAAPGQGRWSHASPLGAHWRHARAGDWACCGCDANLNLNPRRRQCQWATPLLAI
jgi:hypothetical protein